MPAVEHPVIVNTEGGDGAATGESRSYYLNGTLSAIGLEYDSEAPGTTRVIVSEDGGMERVFLDVVSNTDAEYVLLEEASDSDGAALTDDHVPQALTGRRLIVTVSASDEIERAVIARIRVLE